MDINKRLNTIIKEYGWTRYRLSKESGLPQSTLTNIFYRNTTPTIATLEIICKTMNISLADFFAGDTRTEISKEQKELLKQFGKLSPDKQAHILQTIKYMQK